MTQTKIQANQKMRFAIGDMFSIVALVLVLATAVLFILLNYNSDTDLISIEERYTGINTGWQLRNGDATETVDFPVHVEIAPNETVSFSRELPEIAQYYALATRNYHQKLTVYVDGEEIYHFPNYEMYFESGILTDDWNIVHLSEKMSGKTITMEFTAGKYGFKGYMKPVYLGEDNSLIHFLRASIAFPYGLAVGIMAFGAVLIVMGIIYSKYNSDRSQMLAGLMLLAIGIWVTNRAKMPLLLLGSSLKYYLAYVSLMLESVLILLYVGEKFKTKHRRLTNALTIAFLAYVGIVFITVHLMSYPIDRAVPFAYGAIFLASLYLIYMIWPYSFGKETKHMSSSKVKISRIEFIATNLMVWGVVIGIVIDFIVGSDRLWTDVGLLPKLALGAFAVGQMLIHIYKNYHNVEEREVLKNKLHDSQLELMMGQIQPHFIFNTLSSIRTLIKVDPDTAYNMIYDFSNYLRANVDNVTNLSGINFASEVEHIKSYVNIEKVRFGDRLNVQYDINVFNFMVPPLSIQPLVENAIKHGIMRKIEGGTVWLRSYEEGDFNVVEVEDNGTGFTPERFKEITDSLTPDGIWDDDEILESAPVNRTGNGSENHKSSGMKNIYLRLREMANADLELTSDEGVGTKIRILFPKPE